VVTVGVGAEPVPAAAQTVAQTVAMPPVRATTAGTP